MKRRRLIKWIKEHYNKTCGIKRIGRIKKIACGKHKRRSIDVWYNDGSQRTRLVALLYARLKKEIYENRKFEICEDVHHKDGNTLNDKISNLVAIDHPQHMKITNKGENNPMYGKHHNEETKRKISISEMGKNNHWYGKRKAFINGRMGYYTLKEIMNHFNT